jgi:hypothetical protein
VSRLTFALGLGLLLAATTASAEPVDDATRGAARKLGNAGVEAYQAGDFPTAHEKLDKAYRVLKVPSLGLWSARAFVKLGKLVEASERYLEVTRLGLEGGDVTVQKQAQVDAQKELDALAPRVPSIVVVVQGAKPEEVSISVDGTPITSALIGESRPANPGMHAVVGKTSSGEARADVIAVEGKQVTATLVFASSEAAPVARSSTPPTTDDGTPASGSTLRTPTGWSTASATSWSSATTRSATSPRTGSTSSRSPASPPTPSRPRPPWRSWRT